MMNSKTFLTLAVMVLAGSYLHATEPIDLFDGKTLDGWTRYGGEHEYRVRDGLFVGKVVQGEASSYLCTDRQFGDFELTFEVKYLVGGVNSGCQIRSLIRTEDVPLIKGENALNDRSIFWHYPLYLPSTKPVIPVYGTDKLYWRAVPSSMIVRGKWKLIHFYESDTIQLYNIEEDTSEQTDLSTSQPEIAKALHRELKEWVSETGAPVPKTPNRSFTIDGEIANKGDKREMKKSRGKKNERSLPGET